MSSDLGERAQPIYPLLGLPKETSPLEFYRPILQPPVKYGPAAPDNEVRRPGEWGHRFPIAR
jgi:hypothetical protein